MLPKSTAWFVQRPALCCVGCGLEGQFVLCLQQDDCWPNACGRKHATHAASATMSTHTEAASAIALLYRDLETENIRRSGYLQFYNQFDVLILQLVSDHFTPALGDCPQAAGQAVAS